MVLVCLCGDSEVLCFVVLCCVCHSAVLMVSLCCDNVLDILLLYCMMLELC